MAVDGRETETGIGTEIEETGERGEEALIEKENEGVVMMWRGIEGEWREEKEAGAKEGAVTKPEHPKSNLKNPGGRSEGRGHPGGIRTIDWPNWKTWTSSGALTAQSSLV